MTELEKNHRIIVLKISKQLKKFYLQKKKVRIYHGTTNSTRKQKFNKEEMLDVSELNNVISVNRKERYAIAEWARIYDPGGFLS